MRQPPAVIWAQPGLFREPLVTIQFTVHLDGPRAEVQTGWVISPTAQRDEVLSLQANPARSLRDPHLLVGLELDRLVRSTVDDVLQPF